MTERGNKAITHIHSPGSIACSRQKSGLHLYITCSRGKPERTPALHSSTIKMTSRSCTSAQLSRLPTRKCCLLSLRACNVVGMQEAEGEGHSQKFK